MKMDKLKLDYFRNLLLQQRRQATEDLRVDQATEKHPDEANNIKKPLLIHVGEEDEYISKDAQKAIIEALKDNSSAQVFTYPGCSHAFARHRGIHYDKDAAALANGRTADFFKLHLK
jgi:carboxymethylenebutenolidase